MVGLVDEEFGVTIQNSEIATIRTFGDLYEFVYTRLA